MFSLGPSCSNRSTGTICRMDLNTALFDVLERFAVFCNPAHLQTPAVTYQGVTHPHASCPVVSSEDTALPVRGTLASVPITELFLGSCDFCYKRAGRAVLSHVTEPVIKVTSLLENINDPTQAGALLCLLTPQNPLFSPTAISTLLTFIPPSNQTTHGIPTLVSRHNNHPDTLSGCFHHSPAGFSITLEQTPGKALSCDFMHLEQALSFGPLFSALYPHHVSDEQEAALAALSLC